MHSYVRVAGSEGPHMRSVSVEMVDDGAAEPCPALEGMFGQPAEAPIASDTDHLVAGKDEGFPELGVNQTLPPQLCRP